MYTFFDRSGFRPVLVGKAFRSLDLIKFESHRGTCLTNGFYSVTLTLITFSYPDSVPVRISYGLTDIARAGFSFRCK